MDVADQTIARPTAARVSAGASQPVISLIVATVNRTRQLKRLLDSLLTQTRRDFEVIVVDQNPTGVLQSILARYAGKLAITQVACELGVSRARNRGISLARGGLICFPDDDCWYPPHAVADVVAFLETHVWVDMVLGRTIDAEGHESVSRFMAQSAPVTWRNVWLAGNTNALFVRRAAVGAFGGFDEKLGPGSGTSFDCGEDTDFVMMALKSGVRIYFEHSLLIHHDQTDSVIDERYLQRVRGYSVGYGRVLRKHGYSLVYLLYRFARMMPRTLFALARGNMPRVKFTKTWVTGALRGYFSPQPF
jgi:glycosyltransferase involved in cell wall biosynthesis